MYGITYRVVYCTVYSHAYLGSVPLGWFLVRCGKSGSMCDMPIVVNCAGRGAFEGAVETDSSQDAPTYAVCAGQYERMVSPLVLHVVLYTVMCILSYIVSCFVVHIDLHMPLKFVLCIAYSV